MKLLNIFNNYFDVTISYRYDTLLRQHHTLQENLRKRSPSYSADSLDGASTTNQVESLQKEIEELQDENRHLQEKLMEHQLTRPTAETDAADDFIDWKRKCEVLQLENDRLKTQMEQTTDRANSDTVFYEVNLQSR